MFHDSGTGSLRAEYLRKAIENIKARQAVLPTLTLLKGILDAYGSEPLPVLAGADGVATGVLLLNAVLEDIRMFKTAFSASGAGGAEVVAVDDVLCQSGKTYLEHIKARFEFMAFVLRQQSLLLSIEQVSFLWDECVEQALSTAESDRCLLWFTSACLTIGKREGGDAAVDVAITPEIVQYVFSAKMSNPVFLHKLGAQGFFCFRTYFLFVNARASKLVRGSSIVHEDFTVMDWDLYGVEQLWTIVLNTRSEDVAGSAVDFLTMLRHRLSKSLLPEMAARRKADFIRCISTVAEAADQAVLDADAILRTQRCLRMVSALLDESEADAKAFGIHPHAVNLGDKLELSFNSNLSYDGSTIVVRKATFAVYTKERGCDLKNAVAKAIGVPVDAFRVLLHGRELTGPLLGKTLAELHVHAATNLFASNLVKPTAPKAGSAGAPAEVVPEPEDATPLLSPSTREDFPAAVLSDNDVYFRALVRLLEEDSSPELAAKAWALLCRIPTNTRILRVFESLSTGGTSLPSWDAMLQASSPYMVQYNIRVLQSLFVSADAIAAHRLSFENSRLTGTVEGRPAPAVVDAAVMEPSPKAAKIDEPFLQRFVKAGGVNQLLRCLTSTDGPVYAVLQGSTDKPSKIACTVVLQLFQQFVLAAVAQSAERQTIFALLAAVDTRVNASASPTLQFADVVAVLEAQPELVGAILNAIDFPALCDRLLGLLAIPCREDAEISILDGACCIISVLVSSCVWCCCASLNVRGSCVCLWRW